MSEVANPNKYPTIQLIQDGYSPQYLVSNIGPVGPTAFEEWKAISGNEDKTYQDFLDLLTEGAVEATGADVIASAASALAAETSENNAAESETSAETDAGIASTKASEAAASESNASTSEVNAEDNAVASASSATDSQTAKTGAVNARVGAETAEDNAAASAITATNKAGEASTSASDADTSKTAAVLAETGSLEAQTAAELAETNAATSESNASTSEANASNSESAASNSAGSAETSKDTATTKANEASSSATSAETAQTAAELAETNAETAKTAAELAETNAENSESNAAGSASTATSQADLASTSASEAEASKTSAETAQSAAETAQSASETAQTGAETAETGAVTAQTGAETARDDFFSRYIGTYANNAAANASEYTIGEGLFYWDTTSKSLLIHDGSDWASAVLDASGALVGSNNLSDLGDVATALINLGLGSAAESDASDFAPMSHGHSIGDVTGLTEELSGKSDTSHTHVKANISDFDENDYATGVEGDLAATATQPGDLGDAAAADIGTGGVQAYDDVLENTTASYTSEEETKLSNIEANATADQTGAQIKTAYEAEADTNAFTDALATKLNNVEAAADVTDTANVAAAGALMDSEVANLAAVKAFDVATAAQVRSLTGATTMTPEKVLDALVATTPSGTSNFAPDWASFIAATWVVTANRVLSNPTNVIPGSTRSVTVKANTSAERTITFGNQYKGDLPTVAVTNAAFVTLFLYAVSATEILVSDKAWS